MRHAICYTHTERFWLAALGAFGFFAVNGPSPTACCSSPMP